ncbi:hypothetical protein K438DRAFT_1789596 [Mycena galopus ATCC 62051]|nr:hypothetical protein K438DRAFT_1789596 [Mycena galopus ATCC 62051]
MHCIRINHRGFGEGIKKKAHSSRMSEPNIVLKLKTNAQASQRRWAEKRRDTRSSENFASSSAVLVSSGNNTVREKFSWNWNRTKACSKQYTEVGQQAPTPISSEDARTSVNLKCTKQYEAAVACDAHAAKADENRWGNAGHLFRRKHWPKGRWRDNYRRTFLEVEGTQEKDTGDSPSSATNLHAKTLNQGGEFGHSRGLPAIDVEAPLELTEGQGRRGKERAMTVLAK